jgi:retron-type reverse transcriptase
VARPEKGEPLFERLASFSNLYQAAAQARRGKRFKDSTARFDRSLAANLVQLRDELLAGEYRPGPYHTFEIYEPAHRLISAAPYRDRVVHHALCSVIEPLFERSFIYDSYANRLGKGTHRALDRCTQYARRYSYVLRGDVRLFFPSIDHQILLARLARKIRDTRVLALARRILDSSNPQPAANFYFPGDDLFAPFERRRGLPIGNLTSQFWANVYLDPLDHLFKDDLGAPYLRYVDDFLIFAPDKKTLACWREQAGDGLAQLRLLLHQRKSVIQPVREGIPFLGFRVFPTHRRLLAGSVKRARRRFCRLQEAWEQGAVGVKEVKNSVRAWIAHAAHGDTFGLRRHLLAGAVFRAGGRSCASGRLLEQQPGQRRLRLP